MDLRVRLTPGSARDGVDGFAHTADGEQHLAARVRAVPDKGKANTALCSLLAKSLGVPKSSVCLVRGATSRLKTVRIEADKPDIAHITDRLEALTHER